MKLFFLAVVAGCMFITACQTIPRNVAQKHPDASNTDKPVNVEASRIRAHLKFLADDLLEGRDTGSRGHEIAANYIATEFEKYGLVPAGNNGTYFQLINFRQAHLDHSSVKLTLTKQGKTTELSYPKQFITGANPSQLNALTQGELVFVGYGIIAPELGHNDYQDIDVKGKVVVTLSGKPKSFPSEEGAHFGSTFEKKRHAAEHGAVGYITISTPTAEKVRPYISRLNYLHVPTVRWLDENLQPFGAFKELNNSAFLSPKAAEVLFTGAPMNLAQIYAMLEKDKSPKGFDLNTRIHLSSTSTHKTITSPNVAAILPGSDAKLKDQYVVYSAHSDHIGFAKTVKKDRINNGAMDNAIGTAVMLETARLFSELAEKPKRSILFVAVTAEEKGLLGSDYYARNPTVPKGSMVANVNLDMPILTYEFSDVIAFGANHSDMQSSVNLAAKHLGLTLSPDPWPEMALFTRSDHYSFVKQGIPAVFLVPGLTSVDPNVDGNKQFNHFLKTNYHRPSDDLEQNFNWKAATKFTHVNFNIGLTLANQIKPSQWNQGDFFGDTFSEK